MNFRWDPDKAKKNLRDHRIAFERVVEFDFQNAHEVIDADLRYGETRIKSIAPLGGSFLAVLIYVERGDVIRVISLRRATNEEKRTYVQAFR